MMKTALVELVGLYQAVSTALPRACRFEPSCSEYARQALEAHGAARGAWLALRRLARCHPLGTGGPDPVAGSAARPR